MRKVIGIGETVFDIVFENDNPVSGKPGGSVYNALISLGRRNVNSLFISEVGNDNIGQIIRRFLRCNGVDDKYLCTFNDGKSPLAIAFLDENKNAQYSFYKDYPSQRLQYEMPTIKENDIVLYGSYFAINKVIHEKVELLFQTAKKNNAILYYDVNFRATHKYEIKELLPTINSNFEYADIVKGSIEDFEIMYNTTDIEEIYNEHIAPYCKYFICTLGAKGAIVKCGSNSIHIEGKKITPVSTIGAGDSFNAGVIFGLIRNNITKSDLQKKLSPDILIPAITDGISFATEVCQSYENYVSK